MLAGAAAARRAHTTRAYRAAHLGPCRRVRQRGPTLTATPEPGCAAPAERGPPVLLSVVLWHVAACLDVDIPPAANHPTVAAHQPRRIGEYL